MPSAGSPMQCVQEPADGDEDGLALGELLGDADGLLLGELLGEDDGLEDGLDDALPQQQSADSASLPSTSSSLLSYR